jgi:hypothetical protein
MNHTSAVAMGIGHPEAADGVALEVEFDQHHWLLAHNPTIVAWFDRQDLRSLVFHDTTVGIFDMDRALGQEADMGVHAQVGPHKRFHVGRPPESDGVHHALDARRASPSNLKPDTADFSALGTSHGRYERVQRLRLSPNGLASLRDDRCPDVLSRGLLFRHASSL